MVRVTQTVVHAVAILLFAAACGGSGSGNGSSNNPPPVAGNRAPTITGTPPTSAVADFVYSFVPTASDADGDPLVFSIANPPGWATFDTSTGQLSGVPTLADTGTHAGISITVSDGAASTSLGPFDIEVMATGTGSVTLSWTPPTQNADGSPLTDLAGYRVAWGTQAGDRPNLIDVMSPGISSFVVDNLGPGPHFFVISALDTSGNASAVSNEASATPQ